MRASPVVAASLAAVLSLLAPHSSAHACSVCSAGDPLLSARDAVTGAGNLRLDLASEYTSAWARSEEDPATTESLSQLTLGATAAYSPWERVGFLVRLPVVLKLLPGMGALGLGDVDVMARALLVRDVDYAKGSRHTLGLAAGLALPTGTNDLSEGRVRIDEHSQPGFAAFGPYLGLQYRFERDPWSAFVGVGGRAWTANSHDYRHGEALQWTALGQYQPLERLALEVGVDGRWAARDVSAGALQENTGGLVLAATPGAMVRVAGELWVAARVQIPFFTHLFGAQGVGPTYQLGLQWQAL